MRKMTSNSPVPIPNIAFHLAPHFEFGLRRNQISLQQMPAKILMQNAQGRNENLATKVKHGGTFA